MKHVSEDNQQKNMDERDHKKLGKQLDLFVFSDKVGPGLPLWTPRGTVLREELDNFVWELRKKRGYEKVEIPHITKKDLYVTSGHWDKFKDELFRITSREGHEFALKPMNCPHHIEIFKRKIHSYRELPQRYANTTTCYRDEQTGELNGIARPRAFTQDDAHVFCRYSQVEEEVIKIWDIVTEFYATASGFELDVRLSLRDPKEPEKYLGTPEQWDTAEDKLRHVIEKKGVKATEELGEAAFYAPKIDFVATDSLGRQWQVATIQLDINLPDRFDLTCVNEKGENERIAMIHAAIMGSIDRYLSVFIEHYAGAFPLWLSPEQVRVLTVSEKHLDYAKDMFQKLKDADIRAELDDGDESLGKKISKAKHDKLPYFLVIGDKEVDSQNITLESRSGESVQVSVEELIKRLQKEIQEKTT